MFYLDILFVFLSYIRTDDQKLAKIFCVGDYYVYLQIVLYYYQQRS